MMYFNVPKAEHMKEPVIEARRIGYSNATLIANGRNSILVDTGVKGHIIKVMNLFKQNGLVPDDIKLIILTHTHYDHTGNLHELVDLTGASVLVHRNEYENLQKGFTPIPKGNRFYPKFISRLGRAVVPNFASPAPFRADIANTGEFDLSAYGIDARVISTPGHSAGSQSVIVGERLIAGDSFFNLRYGTLFPFFADDPKLLLQTWQKIYDLGVKVIYPGHGKHFPVEKSYPAYERWKKKLKV